jgi:hypothetical protein
MPVIEYKSDCGKILDQYFADGSAAPSSIEVDGIVYKRNWGAFSLGVTPGAGGSPPRGRKK